MLKWNEVIIPEAIDPSILNSSHFPTDTELAHSRSALSEEIAASKSCARDILEATLLLDALHERKSRLDAIIEGHISIVSAVRRLPTDILEIISLLVCLPEGKFALTIDEADYSAVIGNIDPAIEAPPLVLSAVCSRWRQVALGFTELWATISVQLATLTPEAFSILELFLDRSSSHPLHLYISELKKPDDPWFLSVSPWKVLAANFHRCSKLVLDDSGWFNAELRNEPLEISFPILNTFVGIYDTPFDFEEDILQRSLHRALMNAPNLTTLVIEYGFPFLPYDQLTSLTFNSLGDDEPQKVYQQLPLCTQLKHLCFEYVEDVEPPLPPTSLPTLESLDIGITNSTPSQYLYGTDVDFLLSSLSCLSLTTLRIAFHAPEILTNEWLPGLLNMLDRTCSSLLNLSFYMWVGSTSLANQNYQKPHLISQVLERVPNLHSFHATIRHTRYDGYDVALYNSQILWELFSSLLKETVTCRLSPNLQDLSFEISQIAWNNFCDVVDTIIQTAEMRRSWNGVPLKRVDLTSRVMDSPGALSDDIVRRIEGLEKDGVFVSVV